MHPLALACLSGAFILSVRRKDWALGLCLALWVGSDLALSVLRGPLDAGDYSDRWRYPACVVLWLLPGVSGAALGLWRLAGAPLAGLVALGFPLGMGGVLLFDPGLGRAAQGIGGWALGVAAVLCLLGWALGPRRAQVGERCALVVCAVDGVALLGAYPSGWSWVVAAQGTICGLTLIFVQRKNLLTSLQTCVD